MSEAEQKAPRRISVQSDRLRISDDGTQGVLLARKCTNCGTHFFGVPRICLRCMSEELQPVELSKEGTLHTYTIVRMAPPGWQGPVPYILGSVKLPEGPNVTAEIIDCLEENIQIGMSMELIVRVGGKDKEGNEVVVYKFRPKSS